MSEPNLPNSCLNCQAPLHGKFCAQCGQEAKEIRRPFYYLIKDAFKTTFELDGRAWRTLLVLFTRPGFLTQEYISGRRTRFMPPLRLFLTISIGFFLMVSIVTSLQSLRAAIIEQNQAPAESTAASIVVAVTAETQAIPEVIPEEMIAFVDDFNFPFFSEQRNENLRRFMRIQAQSNYERVTKDPSDFFYGSLDYITFFILLMMPILALVQKILYFRSKRFYVEHLMLTLHNHSFVILSIFFANAFEFMELWDIPVFSFAMSLVGYAIITWIFVYLFLSLRNYFGQGYFMTLIKFITMAVIYAVVTAAGIFYFAVILFFLF